MDLRAIHLPVAETHHGCPATWRVLSQILNMLAFPGAKSCCVGKKIWSSFNAFLSMDFSTTAENGSFIFQSSERVTKQRKSWKHFASSLEIVGCSHNEQKHRDGHKHKCGKVPQQCCFWIRNANFYHTKGPVSNQAEKQYNLLAPFWKWSVQSPFTTDHLTCTLHQQKTNQEPSGIFSCDLHYTWSLNHSSKSLDSDLQSLLFLDVSQNTALLEVPGFCLTHK